MEKKPTNKPTYPSETSVVPVAAATAQGVDMDQLEMSRECDRLLLERDNLFDEIYVLQLWGKDPPTELVARLFAKQTALKEAVQRYLALFPEDAYIWEKVDQDTADSIQRRQQYIEQARQYRERH